MQRHRFPIQHGNLSRPMLVFVYFCDFSLRMRSFVHTTTSRLKSNIVFEFTAVTFLVGIATSWRVVQPKGPSIEAQRLNYEAPRADGMVLARGSQIPSH